MGYRGQYSVDDFAQKAPQPLEDESEVIADGGHDGIDLVALASLEEVPAQMAVGFAVTDDGLDGGPPPEFLFDLSMNAAPLAGFEDPDRIWHIVAPVSLVHIDPLDLAAGQRLGLLDDFFQGVAVIGVSGQRLGVQDTERLHRSADPSLRALKPPALAESGKINSRRCIPSS